MSRSKHDSIQAALYQCELKEAEIIFYKGFYEENLKLSEINKIQDANISILRLLDERNCKILGNSDKYILELQKTVKVKDFAFKISFGVAVVTTGILIIKLL